MEFLGIVVGKVACVCTVCGVLVCVLCVPCVLWDVGYGRWGARRDARKI